MNSLRYICRFVLHHVEATGVPPDQLKQLSGVDTNFLRSAPISDVVGAIPRALDAMVTLSDDRNLGMRVGEHFHLGVLGLAGVAASQAANLRSTMQSLNQYSRVSLPWIETSIRHSRRLFHWEIDIVDSIREETASQLAEGWAAALASIGRDQLGHRFRLSHLSLRRKRPACGEPYETAFGCPVEFGATENRVSMDSDVVKAANPWHDPSLEEQLKFATQAVFRPGAADNSMQAKVGNSIRSGRFELSAVSRDLQIQIRTVQRRLKDEGTSFQEVLDETRAELAEIYLQIPSLTVTQVGRRLGYSGGRAFRTAYQRWTGRNPRGE